VRAILVLMAAVSLVGVACGAGHSAARESAVTPVASPTLTPPAPAPAPTLGPQVVVPAPWAPPPAPLGIAPPDVSAAAAVVVDEASGEVLYGKRADDRLAPASLTKIATAVLALEEGDLDATVDVDVDSRVMRNSTVMGLLPGDRFTLRDLLYGMMLPSGNDAALAVGRAVAGSDAAFVREMNALARRLDLRDTSFANPHGLGAREHFMSARDLAMLSRYAMTLPAFREVVGASSWTASGSRAIGLSNINTFLYAYPGADGLKTGYTRRAGPTLAASAVRGGHRVFVVLLNAPARESDAAALMDWAFAAHAWPAAAGSVR
jgi:D-alanyl-D-alanine carboxypeptidase